MDIVCTDLCKAYGDHIVLRDFNLRVIEGEIVSVMAPSGAGKTTLLRILLGLTPQDSGRVEGLTGRRLSAVFQEDRLLPWGSALGNLRFAHPGLTPEEGLRVLDALDIGEAADQKVTELSGGMARRVALARALLGDWDVLLMDEPFRGLDEDAKRRAMDAVLSARRGRTVLFVTHDIREAAALRR